ncbi:MAG: VWA domain-containing protein [Bryobacteraceae bacterium]
MTDSVHPRGCSVRLAVAAYLAAAAWPLAAGQPPAASAAPQNQPEISMREEKATFSARVNLVTVPVVVRDKQGRIVEGLTKQSFRLFDKGKLQEIERFAVEKPGSTPAAAIPPTEPKLPGEAAPPSNAAVVMPRRFIGFLFDDIHIEAGDLMRSSAAARHHIESQLKPTDRAAIFTLSGQVTVPFTDDRDELRKGLARLMPRPIARTIGQQCPDISYYQADMMVNKNDSQAISAATAETIVCLNMSTPAEMATAQNFALQDAQSVLMAGHHETQVSLAVLKDIVQHMTGMPGERVLVLVSPGFLTLAEFQSTENDTIEHALRANVIINTLNARGLYTTFVDASRRTISANAEMIKQNLERQSDMETDGLLAEIAAGTGGVFFHNDNDLEEGFRRTAASPELYYVLGFQPQNLKLDGSFHGLKVALDSKAGYTIEARRGYYAPTHLEDAAATAKREIEDAAFSREELSDLPVTMRAQFVKGAGDTVAVTVLAHLDLAGAKFRKENGRNLDNVTVVTVLFDRNGNWVTGLEKHIDLRLRDETLQYRLEKGMTVRMGLEVKPGLYAVRLVVRDSEGSLMSAINGTLDIP